MIKIFQPAVYTGLKQLFGFLSPRQKFECLLILGFGLAAGFLEIATAASVVVVTKTFIDPEFASATLATFGIDWELSHNRAIALGVCVFSLIYLIKTLVAVAHIFLQNYLVMRMSFCMRKSIIQKFLSMDYESYLMRDTSSAIQILGIEIDNVYIRSLLPVVSLMSELLVIIPLVGFVVYLSVDAGLVLLVVVLLSGWFFRRFLGPCFYHWGKELQLLRRSMVGELLKIFQGFKELLLAKKTYVMQECISIARRSALADAKHTTVQHFPRFFIEIAFVGIFSSAVFLSLKTGVSSSEIVGVLGGYLYLGFRVFPALNRSFFALSEFYSSLPSLQKVHSEYFGRIVQDKVISLPSLRFCKYVVFKEVSYRYPSTKRNILQSCSIVVNKGDWIGIVGETGSGKSTFADLCMGLLPPSSGRITIDGEYSVFSREWRKMIGYVPQKVHIFDDTLESNITFCRNPQEIDRDLLMRCVSCAQLGNFISRLPDGLKTIAGEQGLRISGGERQRIAIARALYQEAEVFVFDEATSALDADTENSVLNNLCTMMQGTTVIMIAHRLSTLRLCNRIFRVCDGRIEEEEVPIHSSRPK